MPAPAILASKGVLSRTSHLSQSNAVNIEAVEWHCTGESTFDLTCSSYRLGFVLEQGGGYCETRPRPGSRNGYRHHGRPFLNLSPPDMQVWACSDEIQYTRSVALSFDEKTLSDRLDDQLSAPRDLTPRLNVEHPQLTALAQMLESECKAPGPFGALYVDSLVVAILVGLMRLANNGNSPRRSHQLAPWQLRTAVEHLDDRVSGRITLQELAVATGLSQSHFSRAFKASTGVAPYQWHLNQRIKRAQQLLLQPTASIAQVAALTGFADQAHLTRAFARATGITPAAWRRDRLR